MDLRFLMFLGSERSGVGFCNAKSTTQREGADFFGGMFVIWALRGTIKGGVQDLGHRLLTADLRTSDLWTLIADY